MRLSIIALGDVHAEDLQPLTTRFEHIEQLVLDVPPRDAVANHRAEFNRAVDAASADWVLIVRERERIDEALAQEIFDSASAAKVRGFRMRSTPIYAGKPLHVEQDGGEVRLFHRRNYMRYANKGEWDEVTVQGTVVRLANAFRSMTFATPEEHRAHLEAKGKRLSIVTRVLRFASYAFATRARDANTLRYLWIEAGFDVTAPEPAR
jgi:hypothetical protein